LECLGHAVGGLRFSVRATLFGFGVQDRAPRGGRLQALGLCSAGLAAALVLLGRALVLL
jgi:hypothetical protein